MIRWCSYCQKFMGEAEPLVDYHITHGMCKKCAEDAARPDFDFTEESEFVINFFRELFSAAKDNNVEKCRDLVELGLQSDFRPSDLAIGFIQPALYAIGNLWETGKITVAHEHKFTSWCNEFLLLLPLRRPLREKPVDFLVLPAFSNVHTLGANMVSMFLSDRGYTTCVLDKPMNNERLFNYLDTKPARALGISVALPESLPNALSLQRCLKERYRVPVMMGGYAFRQPGVLEAVDHDVQADIFLTMHDLLESLESKLH